MSSRTTRGYWKLGAIGCRGASWSKELDDKEPHGGYWKPGAIGCRGASWSKELDDKEPHGVPRSERIGEFSCSGHHRLLVLL